jgi:hypothetical protein
MDAEIILVLVILACTIALFIFEMIRMDIAAMLCMLVLGRKMRKNNPKTIHFAVKY